MKQPSVYLKMRVLGAIDTAPGRTRHERVHNVAAMTFLDEDGNPRQFTWRTIQTWHYRYKNHGITSMTTRSRKDKGQARKVTPEELLEAINAATPHFHDQRTNKRALYRFCVENDLLHPDRISQTTFYRFIREHDLLAAHDNDDNKKRLAFSMKYANQLWQADTMFGPFVDTGMSPASRKQAKLIAFIDDASRVLCHGEFFFDENVDTLVRAIRAAFYKRGLPEQLLVDNGSIYCSQEITLICARVGCILRHTAVRDAAAKGKIERFFRRVRDQFLVRKLDLSSLETLNRQFSLWVENDYYLSLTSLWSHFSRRVADLSSDRRMLVTPTIWQSSSASLPRTPLLGFLSYPATPLLPLPLQSRFLRRAPRGRAALVLSRHRRMASLCRAPQADPLSTLPGCRRSHSPRLSLRF